MFWTKRATEAGGSALPPGSQQRCGISGEGAARCSALLSPPFFNRTSDAFWSEPGAGPSGLRSSAPRQVGLSRIGGGASGLPELLRHRALCEGSRERRAAVALRDGCAAAPLCSVFSLADNFGIIFLTCSRTSGFSYCDV